MASAQIMAEPTRELIEAIGVDHVVQDPTEIDWVGRSACGTFHGRAGLVVRPASTAELSAVVSICARHRIPMVPQGGNTGLAGAATPQGDRTEIVVSVGRMRRVREFDAANATITVEAGITLGEVRTRANESGLLFPVGLGSEGSCQIGGNIATNAGGTQVLRYGNIRPQVLGLEVVLPDGRIWDGLRSLRKDSAGYDMKQIFIGSEGTLGFITAAVLRLQSRPSDTATAFLSIPDPAAALEILSLARNSLGDAVTAFELMRREAVDLTLAVQPTLRMPIENSHQWYLLIEAAGQKVAGELISDLEELLVEALANGLVFDAAIARSEAQRNAMWDLREWKAEAQKFAGPGVKHDVSVPVSAIPAFLAEADAAVAAALPGVRHFAFGHVGDGNIHYNPIAPLGWSAADLAPHRVQINQVVHDIVARYGGSISAEHGIGQLRAAELRNRKSDVEYDMMRTLKASFDPFALMNPGKVLM